MKNQIIIKNKTISLKEKIGELCYCFVAINDAKQSNQEEKVLIPASFWSRFQRNPNYANKVLINEFVEKIGPNYSKFKQELDQIPRFMSGK